MECFWFAFRLIEIVALAFLMGYVVGEARAELKQAQKQLAETQGKPWN